MTFDTSRMRDVQCSPGFILDFKGSHGFTSRRVHLKRRSTLSPEQEQEQVWIREIAGLVAIPDPDAWSVVAKPRGGCSRMAP